MSKHRAKYLASLPGLPLNSILNDLSRCIHQNKYGSGDDQIQMLRDEIVRRAEGRDTEYPLP